VQAALVAEVDGLRRDVDAFCTPVSGKHLEIRTRAAADVENSLNLQCCGNLLDEGLDDPAPSHIPPVSVLNLIQDRVVMRLHLLRQISGDAVTHHFSLYWRTGKSQGDRFLY